MNQAENSIAPIVRLYRKFAVLTIGAIVLLIGIGGMVRSTGSGMGCPDWPKCFGQWVPPTDVSQLPPNYQEIYKDHGYASMEFNAVKTWIEYINRLIGVLIGFITLATAAISLKLRKLKPQVTRLTLFALFLVIVQGGIGAYVVRTNLKTGMVTLHMVVALVILMVLILAYLHSQSITREATGNRIDIPRQIGFAAGIFFLFALVQVILGTQVREEVDLVSQAQLQRQAWIGELGGVYDWHKYFYYGVLGSFAIWAWISRSISKQISIYSRIQWALGILLLTEIGLGILMHHFSIPAWIQPFHLLIATSIIGLTFYFLGHLYIINGKNMPVQQAYLEKA